MFHENTPWPCTDGIMPAKSGKEDREKTDMHDASSDGPAGFGMLHDSQTFPVLGCLQVCHVEQSQEVRLP